MELDMAIKFLSDAKAKYFFFLADFHCQKLFTLISKSREGTGITK